MITTGQYKITALYARLSSDDELQGDSNSIIHQKQILETYAAEHALGNCQFYVDDGFSGTNFDRPDFQRMITDIENDIVGTVVVKDLSRFGRNYYQVGYYTEKFFLEHDIRFISIMDNVDSINGTNEFAPFHNLINDFYAKDIAKKQKAVIESKGNAGQRLTTKAIYGYQKDDNGQWIIDPETAPVVKKIFELCLKGQGVQMIANYLFAHKVKNPSAQKGQYRTGGVAEQNPYLWSAQTVSGILSRQEYCGDTVNFKSHRKSLCSKIVVKNDPQDYKIFENTHEPIVSREDFEKVQEIRSKRKRIKPIEEPVLFSEIYCADCKNRMHIMRSRNYKKTKPDCYVCSLSRKSSTVKQTTCSSHYITEKLLKDYVLQALNDILKCSADFENFRRIINAELSKINSQTVSEVKKEIVQTQKRIDEIDVIIKELYEDKVRGNISIEIFRKLSSNYCDEQKALSAKIFELNKKSAELGKVKTAQKGFFDVVQKYSEKGCIDELTVEIIADFIDRIEIGETKKVDGKRQQQVNIYFIGIGLLDLSILR